MIFVKRFVWKRGERKLCKKRAPRETLSGERPVVALARIRRGFNVTEPSAPSIVGVLKRLTVNCIGLTEGWLGRAPGHKTFMNP